MFTIEEEIKYFNINPASLIPETILREVEERVQSLRRLEDQKILIKAQDGAKQMLFQRACLNEYFQTFQETGDLPIVANGEVKQIMEAQCKKLSSKPPFCLITINPRSDITLPVLKKTVEKFLKKKTIPQWFQVYEVRKGETGLHAHILLRYTPTPFAFKRGAQNTFKNVCDSKNSSILNFKFIQENILLDKINYMLGEKKDSKLKGVKDTILYRKKHSLPKYEESSPPLTCRATQIPPELID